jgi:hypothetical protein
LAHLQSAHKGDIWFGKIGTAYEGVKATIEEITARNVQLRYDRIVQVNGLQLSGEVMGKGNFLRMFEPVQQMEINLFEWKKDLRGPNIAQGNNLFLLAMLLDVAHRFT